VKFTVTIVATIDAETYMEAVASTMTRLTDQLYDDEIRQYIARLKPRRISAQLEGES